jgi:tripartite-type tricarboxylate transporter receptor subunit TctC
MTTPRIAIRAGAALALALTCAHAPAQAPYPARPVTMIVPFPPGGGTDVGARLIAQKLTLKWGQTVVVENRGGAAGIVGMDAAAKAKPDGHTIVMGNVGTIAINQSLYKSLPYDADNALVPVVMVADLPLVLLAHVGLKEKTPAELIAAAKASPGKYTFASSGAGGAPHLAAEIFQNMAGVKMLHVPYKGGGPAVADLIAGHVNILFTTILEAVGQVKGGKLNGMAVSSKARSPALPDVPTLAEAALPGYESGSWIGLMAPAGTPAAIIDKIAADTRDIVAQADTRQTLIGQGALPRGETLAQFAAVIDTDRRKYARIIIDKGIRSD